MLATIKIIGLCLICFVLSGCSVEYNVEITNKNILENIVIDDYVTETRSAQDIMDFYESNYPVYDDEDSNLGVDYDLKQKYPNVNYYDKKISIDNYSYHMTYDFNHNLKDYYRSYLLVHNYEVRKVEIKDNKLYLATNSINNYIKYYDLEKLTVNIKTDYKVIENNADLINDNVYTWYFTKENNATKRLKMNIDLSTSKDEEELKEQENLDKQAKSKTNMIIIGIVILIYLGVMIYIVFKRKK